MSGRKRETTDSNSSALSLDARSTGTPIHLRDGVPSAARAVTRPRNTRPRVIVMPSRSAQAKRLGANRARTSMPSASSVANAPGNSRGMVSTRPPAMSTTVRTMTGTRTIGGTDSSSTSGPGPCQSADLMSQAIHSDAMTSRAPTPMSSPTRSATGGRPAAWRRFAGCGFPSWLERQLHAGRELEAAGQFAHLVGECGFGFGAGVVGCGDDQIFEDLRLFRLDERRVDADRLSFRSCRSSSP